MLRLTAIVFFLFYYVPSFSQNCKDTSFLKLYYSPDAALNNLRFFVTKDDVTFLAGNYINKSTNDTAVYLMKLSALGDVTWAKKISVFSKILYWITSISELDNGDIIIHANEINSPVTSTDNTITLIKFDKNGNLIWSKNINTPNLKSDVVTDCRMYYFNKSLYLLYMYEGIGYSTTLCKLDTAANIIWNKQYNTIRNNNYETVPIGMIEYNDSLIIWGRCLSFTLQTSYCCVSVSEQNGGIGQSMLYYTPKELNVNGSIGLYAGYSGLLNFYTAISKADNNTFYLAANDRYYRGRYTFKFDKNMNIYDGNFYSPNNNTQFSLGKIAVDELGNTNIINTDNNNLNQYFVKLDKNGNIVRQKYLSTEIGDTIYTGINPFSYKRNYMSLITRLQKSNGKSYLQLYQLSNEEQNSSCYGIDTNIIKISPYPISKYQSPFFDKVVDLPLTITNLPNVTVTDLPITKQDVCQQISNCTSLKILPANNTICDTSKSYIFSAIKNVSCYKHVAWQIDTAVASQINPINDTAVSIKFKKTWQGYLYASINSCSLLKDSIWLNVFISPDTINLGADTIICANAFKPFTVTAKTGFKKYTWQDGSSNTDFSITKAGKYYINATNYCDKIFADTINITIDTAAIIHLGNDTSICSNKSITLNSGNNFKQYKWSTGETSQTIIANTAKEYIVIATDNFGCKSTDTIKINNVYPIPIVNLSKKNILCNNQNNVLKVADGYASYKWQDGSLSNSYTVTQPGKYYVTVANEYDCSNSDTVVINKVISAPDNFLPTDTAVCEKENILLQTSQSFNTYSWNTGSQSPSITINSSGIYILSVKDENGCIGRDSTKVLYKECPETVFFPNSFTPNNDGINDIYKPTASKPLQFYHLSIYNRYGQKLFESNNPLLGWDGRYHNAAQNIGSYIYQCTYQFKNAIPKSVAGYCLLLH